MIGTALLVDSVQDVFSIVGAIASNSKAILFPCLFYFAQIIKKDKQRKIKFYFSVGIFIVFACLGLNGIISNFIVGGGSHWFFICLLNEKYKTKWVNRNSIMYYESEFIIVYIGLSLSMIN